MYKIIYNSKLPKVVKIIAYILLTLTMVYLIGMLLYRILDALRIFMHWVSDKRNWWTFIVCLMILFIGSVLIAQFALNLDPFGKLGSWIVEKWNELRDSIASIIGGN